MYLNQQARTRMIRLKNHLLVLFCILAFAYAPSTAGAQSPCHLLTSADPIPEDFGAAFDLFSPTQELLLRIDCGPASEITLQVGQGEDDLYIYKAAYEWTGSSWRELALSGPNIVGDWYLGSAATNLIRSEAQLAQDNFVVAYACLRDGGRWKCGCRDASCSTSHWQLQAFTFLPPSPPPPPPLSDAEDGGDGGEPGGGEIDPIPSPTRTIMVSSNGQLSSALSSAQPGDHIVLANGSYSGFTISRNGQDGKPIVVRAANTLGARINGGITLDGDFTWAMGFDVTGGGSARLSGNGNRISSSRFRSQGRSITTSNTARHGVIDHNEIISQSTGKETGWYGIALLVNSGDGTHHHRVYRNYLRDAPALTSGDDNGAIGCSINGFRWDKKTENIIEYNLITNWRGDGEVIMAKASHCTVRFNTIVNSLEINTRVGFGSKWIANWCENSQGIRIHGVDNQVIGNRCNIRIMAGDCAVGQEAPNGCAYTPAARTIVAGNTGTLRLGYGFPGYDHFPIRETVVEAHNGSIERLKETTTSIASSAFRTIPTAVRLTPTDVGPNAPTAPKL